jgi:predicted MPP superfamily phosphohydrolase
LSALELIALAASCGADLLFLGWRLLASSKPLSSAGCLRALALSAGFAALKLPFALSASSSLFFAISLVYVDLVVVVPAAALVVLGTRRGTTRGARALLSSAAVSLPLVGLYATFVEPFRLVEERVDVALDPRFAPGEPLRVAVLADLQSREVDEHLRAAIAMALAFEPHLILLPGDLIHADTRDEFERAAPQFRELLAPLSAPLGVYFVLGNTDAQTLVGKVFEGTNVRLLENEAVELEFAGKRVLLGGAGMNPFAPATRAFVERFDVRESDELRLLVAHYPDIALRLDGSPAIDLIVAGHTHGGQVQLPWFGAPITLSRVPRAIGAGGLHDLDGRSIYVSRGIGCERGAAPRLRFLCPPEVSLLTLRAR